MKIDDGGARARMPVLLSALRRLGVVVTGLDDLAREPVLGGSELVGEVRPIFSFS